MQHTKEKKRFGVKKVKEFENLYVEYKLGKKDKEDELWFLQNSVKRRVFLHKITKTKDWQNPLFLQSIRTEKRRGGIATAERV